MEVARTSRDSIKEIITRYVVAPHGDCIVSRSRVAKQTLLTRRSLIDFIISARAAMLAGWVWLRETRDCSVLSGRVRAFSSREVHPSVWTIQRISVGASM